MTVTLKVTEQYAQTLIMDQQFKKMKPSKRTMKPIKPLRPKKPSRYGGDEGGASDGRGGKRNKQTIRIPSNHRSLIKAALIGKGGSQIKLISELSGCKVSVEESRVVIYGENYLVAVDLVQSVINNVLCVFEHPNIICNIYEMEEDCRMKLIKYGTPVFVGKSTNQTYYRLVEIGAGEVLPQAQVENHDGTILEKKLVKSDHQLYSQRKENSLISEGLTTTVSNFLKLDQVEGSERKLLIKLGLGKKVFYDAKRNIEMCVDKEYTFNSFSKLNIGYGKDIKSSFRLEMGEKFAADLKQYLLNNNWKLENTIKSATCYMVKLMEGILGSSGGKRLSFKILPKNSSVEIGKIKNAMDKLCYLDFCNLEDYPDLRLRFETEQYSRESTDELFNKFIASLKFNQENQVDISGVSKELLDIFRIDSIRNKIKEVYCLNGLKITINKILSKGNGWYEISMSSLQPYNELTSSEDIKNLLRTMRNVLNGVFTSGNPPIVRKFNIAPEKTKTTLINQTKTQKSTQKNIEKETDNGSSYLSVLAVAAFCTAVGFGLTKLIHK